MGDFFTTPPNPEVPPPPGQDQFDIPPPNFRIIGQMFAAGVQDAGGLGGLLKNVTNTAVKFVTAVVGAFLSLLLCIVAFLINLINRVDDAAVPGINAVAAQSLAHVFGIPVGGAGPRKAGAGVDTKSAADNIGRDVLAAIIAGVGQSSGAPIQPTSVPTEQFLSKITHIGIEGWMEGAIVDLITAGQVEAVLQLVPIMADILGLGRLSRRVLAPPLKILVEDPYTWLLNDRYRPALLAHDQATRQYLRGRMDRHSLDRELGRQGFSASAIEALININSKFVAEAELDFAIAHQLVTTDQAVQELRDSGWDEVRARQILQLAELHRLDAWAKQYADDSIKAYVAGEIDEARLATQLSLSQLPDRELDFAKSVAINRRLLNVRHLTLGEVQTMVKAHIMTIDDVRAWMTRENYPLEEQTFLELLLLGEITTAGQAAAAKKAKADAAAAAAQQKLAKQQAAQAAAQAKLAAKGVSLAAFEQLVTDGLRSFDDFAAFLKAQNFSAAAIADLTDLLHFTITAKQNAAEQHAALLAEADTKHIPLASVEKSVLAGTLAITDLQRFMQDNEYAPGDIQIAVSYVNSQLAAAAAKAQTKADAKAKAAEKDISLPELERAARLGLTTVDEYAAALDAAGFDSTSRDLMVGILKDQIASDQAALAKRAAAAAAAKKNKLPLADIEKAVIAGLRPMTDYSDALAALGFSPDDQATLVSLLQLQVDHAKDVAAKRAAADAKLKARNLSEAQLERAVKLGVLSIDQYTAELTADGFSAEDITILSTSLLADLANLRQIQARKNTISKALAKKGVSLAQEDALVKAGIVPLGSYQAFLLAQGYGSTDAANLSQLLSGQIDQAAAAEKVHQAAIAKAQDRDISLADLEKAVLAGVRTMDDYQAQLADLGFNAIDQATLVALLSEKVAAARAKAAG